MLIGVTGLCQDSNGNSRIAGAGKDEVAKYLCSKHGFVLLSFADPMKRFCQDVYEFSDEQLWGGSELRTKGDSRYPRIDAEEGPTHLTPRYALQTLGDAWGRGCYDKTWTDYAMRVVKKLQSGGYLYEQRRGLVPCAYLGDNPYVQPKTNVVITDVRYFNESQSILDAGGLLFRVRRRVAEVFGEEMNNRHQSEVELPSLDDSKFSYVLDNSGGLGYLHAQIDRAMDMLKGKIRLYDDAQANVPPFMRR